jgi:PIN domain nuclease of toxin-antitoxin system
LKVLLDTQAFLWALTNDQRLSRSARNLFTASTHELVFSVASVWETLIKAKIGRLALPDPAGPFLKSELRRNSIALLPILLSHVLRLEKLPEHHRDPFDRILLAQAIEEELPILSADEKFRPYPVQVLW